MSANQRVFFIVVSPGGVVIPKCCRGRAIPRSQSV
jgi:hypothetical protein